MNNKTFWEAYAELGSKDFKTYAGISKLSDNELGYCFATNRAIADKCKKHLTTVSTDINVLIKKGYLFSIEIKDKITTVFSVSNNLLKTKSNRNRSKPTKKAQA